MKILFVAPGLLYSEKRPFERLGSESVICGISREMARRGHEVYITGRFDNFKKKECETIDGIQFVNVRTLHLKDECVHQIASSLLYSKAVAEKIKQINPDIVSLNERFSAYFPAKLKVPKTFTTHNPDAMAFYREFAIRNNRLNYVFFGIKKRIEESVMSRSNVIIALNKSIDTYLRRNGFTNTCVIPNAVDAAKYADKGDDNFILYAGRLSKVKGLTCLIKAFAEISRDCDTNLLLVGSGPEERHLRKIVTSNEIKDRVHFVPTVDKAKLSEYLSKCTIFVSPSLYECMPVTLLEAMASGKPVVASDIPGPQDVITHGYNGFLFERGNIDELKHYVELCLSDEGLRKKIGSNARRTIEDKYTFDVVARMYLDVYKKLIGER